MSMDVETFWEIVEEERAARGIPSYRAIEAAGGVANGTISQRKDILPPTATTITAIAQAFHLPVEVVTEWTRGHRTQEEPRDEELTSELIYVFRQLSGESKVRALAQIRALKDADERIKYTVERSPR